MNSNYAKPIGDLVESFAEHIGEADLYYAKALGSITSAIVKKRVSMNMTQRQFAQYMNVTQGLISRWESADYNFTVKTIAEICEKLNLNLEIDLTPDDSAQHYLETMNRQWHQENLIPTEEVLKAAC